MHKRYQGEPLDTYLDRVENEIMRTALQRKPVIDELLKDSSQDKPIANIQYRAPLRIDTWAIFHMMVAQSNRCYWCCDLLTDRTYHIDHIYPRAKGGSDHPSNLRISCVFCNLSKCDTLPMDFALSLLSI